MTNTLIENLLEVTIFTRNQKKDEKLVRKNSCCENFQGETRPTNDIAQKPLKVFTSIWKTDSFLIVGPSFSGKTYILKDKSKAE